MESKEMMLVQQKNEKNKLNNAVQFVNIRNIYLPGEITTVSYLVTNESLLSKTDSLVVQREELVGVDRLRERWAVSEKSHGDIRRIRVRMPQRSAFELYRAYKKNTFRGVQYRFIYTDQENHILSRSEPFKVTDQFGVIFPYINKVDIKENQLAAEVLNKLTCPVKQPYSKPPVITELNVEYKMDREIFIEPQMQYWTTNNGWRKPVYPHHIQNVLGVKSGSPVPFRYASPDTALMKRGRSMSPNTSIRVYNNTLSQLYGTIQSIEETIGGFEEMRRATQQRFLTLCQRIKTQQIQVRNAEAKFETNKKQLKSRKVTLDPMLKDLSNLKLSCNETQTYVDDVCYSAAMQAQKDIAQRTTIKESAVEENYMSGLWEMEERHYKQFKKSQNQFSKQLTMLRKQKLGLLENISHLNQVHDKQMERHMIDEESARQLHRKTKIRNEKRIDALNEMIKALRISEILRQPLLRIIQDLEDQIERKDELIKQLESDDYYYEENIQNTLLQHIENLENLIEEKNLEICRLNLESLEKTEKQDKICSTTSKTDKSVKTDDLKTTDRSTGVAETCSEDLNSLHHPVMKSQVYKSQSSGSRVPNTRIKSEKKIKPGAQRSHNEMVLFKENVLLRALLDLLTIPTAPPIKTQWFSPAANHKRVQKAASRKQAENVLSADSLENSLKMLFERVSETRTAESNESLRMALLRLFAEEECDGAPSQLSSASLVESLLPMFGPENRPETNAAYGKTRRFDTSRESLNECLQNLFQESENLATQTSNTSVHEGADLSESLFTRATQSSASLDWETLRWVLGSDTSLNKVKQPEPTFSPSVESFHKALLSLCKMKSEEKCNKRSLSKKSKKHKTFTTSDDSLADSLARLFKEISNESLTTANTVYNGDLAEGAVLTSNPVQAESANSRSVQARRLAGIHVSDITGVGQAAQNRTEFRSATQDVGQRMEFRSLTEQSAVEPLTTVQQVRTERIDRRERQYCSNKTKKTKPKRRRF